MEQYEIQSDYRNDVPFTGKDQKDKKDIRWENSKRRSSVLSLEIYLE